MLFLFLVIPLPLAWRLTVDVCFVSVVLFYREKKEKTVIVRQKSLGLDALMLFPFTSAERLWKSDLLRFHISIAQKQKQKTTWVFSCCPAGLPPSHFGKCRRAMWSCHSVSGFCWEGLSVLLAARSLSHGAWRNHHLWVLLTSGVLKTYKSCWSHSTTGKGYFQFKYVSLVLFPERKMNICFSKEWAASQDIHDKMI